MVSAMSFWRPDSLTEREQALLQCCLEAHAASAARENVSTAVMYAASMGSRSYTQALAAALSTLGGTHAPLVETYEVLGEPAKAAQLLDAGRRVPGWGNSFAKGAIDPVWQPLATLLQTGYPGIYQPIEEITVMLHLRGRMIYPNPSCLTAATGMALRMPKEVIPWIFVHGRLAKWSEIFVQTLML